MITLHCFPATQKNKFRRGFFFLFCFFQAFFFLGAMHCYAQPFLRNEQNKPLSFKEIQIQYKNWAAGKNLKNEKYWKYFKRWEMDMQMHSNAQGEPAEAKKYIDEVVKAAGEKMALQDYRSPSMAWYPVGPDVIPDNQTGYMENGIGRINCIAFHPSSTSTYFVGVAQGGLWKTTNNGQSWTPLTDHLPITRISDIAIDPNNPDIIYISVCDFEYVGFGLYLNGKKRNTHYGLGVYKSIDGGNSWQATGLTFQLTDGDASLIRKVIVSPAASNNLIACGVSGMYSSYDGGTQWTKKLDTLFWDMEQDPVNPNTIYAASGWIQTSGDGYAAIFKSADFGNTWSELNTDIPPTGSVQRIKLAVAPSDNNYIYAVAVNTDNGLYGIYKSTDAGLNWVFIDPGINILDSYQGFDMGGQGNYDLAVLVNAANKNVIYVGGINLWGSDDGAQSFFPVSHWTTSYGPTVHADIHFLKQQPVTGYFFVCNDGGVYRTSDIVLGNWNDANDGIPWPTQWTNISNGLAISSFYRISSSRNSSGRILAGAQDNATFYFDGNSWRTIFGGDGMDNYLDTLIDGNMIGSSQYGYFYRSDDDGLSSYVINSNPGSEVAEWTTPITADYNQYGVLYTGYSNVNKTVDGGISWVPVSNFPSGFNNNEISAIAVAPSSHNIIYAAKRVRYEFGIPGSIFKTEDGGNSWSDVTSGLPDSLYYTSVEVEYGDSNSAYVTMAGMSEGNKVFKTADGGNTWQNISYNLPNIPVNCIKNIPFTKNMIVATDVGIYVLFEDSAGWVNQSAGLPNVIVSDIEFNLALQKIYICTFGRGIWASDMETLTFSEDRPGADLIRADLFPNVNNGTFTIHFNQANPRLINMEIINIKGQVVYTAPLSGRPDFHFDLGLLPGMYFARLKGEKFNCVRKFIVE